MPKLTRIVCAGLLLGVAACSPGGDQPPGQPESGPAEAGREVQPGWREDWKSLGQETYQRVCSACHDSGENGAPVTGNREDWAGRSDMWQAVLAGHAKSGYFDMPVKGGSPELTDREVEAATEYMMAKTFPELPTD